MDVTVRTSVTKNDTEVKVQQSLDSAHYCDVSITGSALLLDANKFCTSVSGICHYQDGVDKSMDGSLSPVLSFLAFLDR